jgi:hypothetical protein
VLVASKDAGDELRLFAPPGVESESFAGCLELVAQENFEDAAKVERSLSDDGVDVGVVGPPVGDVELEPSRQLGQAFAGKLLQDSATVAGREAAVGGHVAPDDTDFDDRELPSGPSMEAYPLARQPE